MKFFKRKSFYLILCALLIVTIAATAGFAEDLIDLSEADYTTSYTIPGGDDGSDDVRIIGSYVNETGVRTTTFIKTPGYEGTITLDEINILENASNSTENFFLFDFPASNGTPAVVTLSLSGDSTIAAANLPPLLIPNSYLADQNELIITGTGRLTVTAGHDTGNAELLIPAIGANHAKPGYTVNAGSVTIENGYLVATGFNAPAIGSYSDTMLFDARIRISGGIVEAKNNLPGMPSIGLYSDIGEWAKTYITSGSVSADVGNPVNDNDTELSRDWRDLGVANAGREYSFDVLDTTAYTYTFSVPDDGVAWLWVPPARFGDIPLVPQTTITADSPEGPIELEATVASGTPDYYRWFKAESESGDFVEIPGATEATYTDYDVVLHNTYWYQATPVYSSGYFNDVYSNIVSVTSGMKPELTLVSENRDVKLTLDMRARVALEYKWFRSTSEDGPFVEIGTTTTPSYVDKNVVMGTTYWYYATADNLVSDIKSITPTKDYCCSSGGCNAGLGALAMLGLLAPVVVYLKNRK
ncbi:SYNERG-CTERM sorting domain-containing protein [Synergistaceae bacterium OttesenSCG-928-D05]|nr:SYNERG-CTERM sorting domain-containing protein [Synergistaceae bacterium OttesenSCG-928-D05]